MFQLDTLIGCFNYTHCVHFVIEVGYILNLMLCS